MTTLRRIANRTILFAFVLSSLTVVGQDIHFSQFNSSPLLLNPALAGVNSGNYRLVANYKSQWTQLAPYNTVAASYDMNLFKHYERTNFAGIGLFFFTDKAGDSELRTTQVNLNLSYTVLLNEKGSQSISSGIMAGLGHRSINTENLTWNSQFGVGGYSPNGPRENLNATTVLYPDIGAGFLWNYAKKSKNLNFYAGGSVAHLNMPNVSFVDEPGEKLFIKYALHGGAHIGLSKQVFILPSFMYLSQGPHNQFTFGGLVKVRKSIIPTENTAFYIGGSYRLKDALILNARMDVGDFNLGFSYDIILSGLTPGSNANGGPELSLIYTGIFSSKKKESIFCPPML